MTHPKWYLIDNQTKDFESKMSMCKAAVHNALHKDIGTWFEGKYLIRHMKLDHFMPVELSTFPPYETLIKQIDFINLQNLDPNIVSCSVEKRGNDEAGYCYIQNFKLKKIIDGRPQYIEKK
jgi:hypothetical protein